MIRPYQKKDKEALISLLRLNTPQYFHSSEEKDFIMYLDNYADHYFIVEEEGSIVGSGGYNYIDDDTTVRISWDMIHPEFHGKGIGTKLANYRINLIKNDSKVSQIDVRTTQLVYKFYEKIGFTLEKTEKDFWAEGFDLYHMRMSKES